MSAPERIYADADYDIGDGNCGLHEIRKRACEPAIEYVRADIHQTELAAAHARIAEFEAALEKSLPVLNAAILLQKSAQHYISDGEYETYSGLSEPDAIIFVQGPAAIEAAKATMKDKKL